MKETNELRKLFDRRLEEAGTTVFYGKVTVVDETARTCTVEIDGIAYENVLLYAIEKADLKGFVFIPAVDSQVLVKRIGDDRYCIEMFSEITRIIFTVENISVTADGKGVDILAGDSDIKITPGGMTFVRGGSGLKKTLSDLLDAITKLTVTTAVGPSGVPINTPDFIKIKQDLNNYLEQ